MITIEKLTDLDRAVAVAAFCPEPPMSERRAILFAREGRMTDESGAWRWMPSSNCTCASCLFGGSAPMHDTTGHWEPAPFSTDPAASYALEQKMRERFRKGWWQMRDTSGLSVGIGWRVTFTPMVGDAGYVWHESRLIAMCFTSLRALGVDLDLLEGWDAR